MAKTFTQKNQPVSFFNYPEATELEPSTDMQMQQVLDKIKNLRIRPSLSSVRRILDYAKLQIQFSPC